MIVIRTKSFAGGGGGGGGGNHQMKTSSRTAVWIPTRGISLILIIFVVSAITLYRGNQSVQQFLSILYYNNDDNDIDDGGTAITTTTTNPNSAAEITKRNTITMMIPETAIPITTNEPDYGDIQYTRAEHRVIIQDYDSYEQEMQLQSSSSSTIEQDDGPDKRIFAVDDMPFWTINDNGSDSNSGGGCIEPSWSLLQKPTCNLLHELNDRHNLGTTTTTTTYHYLGQGSTRDVWLLQKQCNDKHDEEDLVVLKQQRFDLEYSRARQLKIKREAAILDKLQSYEQIMNVYQYCSFSILVEPATDISKRILVTSQQDHSNIPSKVVIEQSKSSFNNLTDMERKHYAVSMAQSLAILHGHETGPIVCQDVKLEQWLQTKPKNSNGHHPRIVLNDLDQVEFLAWNVTSNHQYCPSRARFQGGLPSPPGYLGDESPDVWRFCGILYSILTGLPPYWDQPSRRKTILQIRKGTAPRFPPYLQDTKNNTTNQSPVEVLFMDIINNKCYQPDPKQRSSIFDILKLLEDLNP